MELGQERETESADPIAVQLRRAQHALHIAGIGTWEMDLRTRAFTWDARCMQHHGFTGRTLNGYEELLPIIHPEDFMRLREAVSTAMEGGNNGQYEIRYRVIDETGAVVRWIHGCGAAEIDADGNPSRITGTTQDITDLTEARQKASDAEHFAQVAIEAAGAGSYQIIAATGELIHSPTLKRIFTGSAEGRLTQDEFVRLIHPDDVSVREQALEVARRTGQLNYEIRVIWPDRSVHWLRATGTYEYDVAGTPVVLSGIMEDITDYMQARLAIDQSERLSRSVFENSPVAKIITVGDEFRIEALNKRMVEILGVNATELAGRPLTEAIPSLINSNLPQLLWEVKNTGTSIEVAEEEIVNLNPAEPERSYFEHRHSPLRDTSGNIYGVISTWIDISREVGLREAEKGYQEALRASELLFRSVTNSAPAGLWLSSADGSMVYFNKTFCDWTGLQNTGIPDRSWTALIDVRDRETFEQRYYPAVAGGDHFETEFRLRTISGALRWCRFSGDPYFHDDGGFAGYAGFCMDIDAEVNLRQRIEEANRRLISSFNDAPVGIAILSKANYVITLANALYGTLSGRTPADLIGQPLFDALPELQDQGFRQVLDDVLATGVPYSGNEVLLQIVRDGQPESLYVNISFQPQRDVDGIKGVLVVVTDVTAMVRARQALEESEARFRELIGEAPVATCMLVGREMRVEIANEMMRRAWGKDESVLGKPLWAALPELEGQPFLQILDDVYQTGVPYVAEAGEAKLEVGGQLSTFYFNFTYKPLFNQEGKVYAIINTAMDVTEAVVARRKLEEAQSALMNAIDLAELGTWSLDIATGAIQVSQRMLDWFGLTEAEAMLGEAVTAMIPSDRQRVSEAIAAACLPGASTYSEEYTVQNRLTGRRHVIHAQGKVVTDPSGTPLRLDGTARDISLEREVQAALEQLVQLRTEELAATNEELQATNEELLATNEEVAEANERLVHSNEELAQYAYVASHDLQEPLRKIRVFSGMLNQSSNMVPEDLALLSKISGSAERMSLLIGDLLEFSRLLNSDSTMQLISLGEVANAIRTDFELRIMEKDALVHIGTLPRIEAVSLQMNQLFYNLIGNALKFVKDGIRPEIRISATPVSTAEAGMHIGKTLPGVQYHRITIADNGIGFEPQYTEQIFEVFKRLHGREMYPGSGIGLALCRRIVNNHMGVLYAESAPGAGSAFHIILPERQWGVDRLIS